MYWLCDIYDNTASYYKRQYRKTSDMLNRFNLKMKNKIEEDNKLVLKKLIIDISTSNSIMKSAIAVI